MEQFIYRAFLMTYIVVVAIASARFLVINQSALIKRRGVARTSHPTPSLLPDYTPNIIIETKKSWLL